MIFKGGGLTMKKLIPILLLAALMLPAPARPAHANDERREERGRPRQAEMRRFHERDGHRHDGFHEGRERHEGHERRERREGWRLVFNDIWLFRPAPVYVYPDEPYPLPVAVAPPVSYWYYCSWPRGYYPYVTACTTAWQSVPAMP